MRSVALETVAPATPPAPVEPFAACRDALQQAGATPFVASAAAARAPLTVVVNDPHRFTDTRTFVRALCDVIDRQPGAAPVRMRLLVAAGSHVSTADERAAHEERILGPHARRFEAIAWHDARAAAGLRPVGRYRLHHWMAEGGHYVGCGSMEPHYFAGVTGAHKTLTVGVMAIESLAANHEHAMSTEAAGLRLAGNPVHDGIAAAVADLEGSGARLLVLNQVVVGGRIVGCTAGAPLAALAAGLPLVRACFSHAVDTPLDVVVARVGPPLDRDLYQADKGIKNTEGSVRDGGTLILEARCTHGVGLDQFVELLRAAATYREAVDEVRRRGYRLGDHKAVRLRALTDTRGVALALVAPGLDPALGSVLGMHVAHDRASAARFAAARLEGHAARGLVVEDAGNLTLELR